MIERCTLCPGRVCVPFNEGRLINDNLPDETELDKIKLSETPIDECEFRTDDDERLLVGS